MSRPIHAFFDLAAFRSNLHLLRARGQGARVWAVVKANAYGHGLERAVRALGEADGFALLDLGEAVRLRERGFAKPLLLLEGFFEPSDLEPIVRNDITAVVHSGEQLAMLERAGLERPMNIYLKMNTGMNRLGFPPERFRAAFERARACAAGGSVSLMTHFADADGPGGVAEQLARFESAAAGIRSERSLANSAASLRFPETAADWIRPGIALYGCSPFPDETAGALGLRPVMTLSSEVIAVQALRAGDRVGYGGIFAAARPMRIGVVACGYADGYPRHAPTGTPVLVGGRRTGTVGRVSMDMLCIDLTPFADAGVGSKVTLWGEGLSADEVATAAGTVSYELLCALAARVPQVEQP